jgi:hypothetical protein
MLGLLGGNFVLLRGDPNDQGPRIRSWRQAKTYEESLSVGQSYKDFSI